MNNSNQILIESTEFLNSSFLVQLQSNLNISDLGSLSSLFGLKRPICSLVELRFFATNVVCRTGSYLLEISNSHSWLLTENNAWLNFNPKLSSHSLQPRGRERHMFNQVQDCNPCPSNWLMNNFFKLFEAKIHNWLSSLFRRSSIHNSVGHGFLCGMFYFPRLSKEVHFHWTIKHRICWWCTSLSHQA